MTNEHTSLEKYTFIRKGCKRVVSEMWVGDGIETATYWPRVPLTIAALLPHSAGLLNRGPEGPSLLSGTGSHNDILSPTTGTHCLELNSACLKLQLTRSPSYRLYNCFTYTCFLWASQLHRFQPVHRSRWYLDIFDRMHLFIDWRLGRGPICYTRMTSGVTTCPCQEVHLV